MTAIKRVGRRLGATVALLLISSILGVTKAETTQPNTGDQPNGFLFGFTTTSLPLPITPSCPSTLTLSQSTALSYGGPDPSGPYTLIMMINEQVNISSGINSRIYTHSIVVPNMISAQQLKFPLGPSSQFIGCIWAANGVSGGCQDLFTVFQSNDYAAGYANSSSTCQQSQGSWLTPTDSTLSVRVQGAGGDISNSAWPASCTDLKFTPNNGTPPYTLVIAPAMHPPINISGIDSSTGYSMNYTIRLTHGQAFMASVFDKNGASFTIGPLHAGTSKELACLATLPGQSITGPMIISTGISAGALGGGIVGAFVVGAVLAFIITIILTRKRGGLMPGSSSTDGEGTTRPAAWRTGTSSSIMKPIASPVPFSVDGDDNSPTGSSNTDGQHVVGTLGYRQGSQSSPPITASTTNPYDRLYTQWEAQSMDQGGARLSPGSNQALSPTSNSLRPELARSISAQSTPTSQGHNGLYSPSSAMMSPNLSDSTSIVMHERSMSMSTTATAPARNVYVVHSDAGNNVHITLPDGGANVIELPPGYQPSSTPMHHHHMRGGGGGGPGRRRRENSRTSTPQGGEKGGLRVNEARTTSPPPPTTNPTPTSTVPSRAENVDQVPRLEVANGDNGQNESAIIDEEEEEEINPTLQNERVNTVEEQTEGRNEEAGTSPSAPEVVISDNNENPRQQE